MNETKDYRVLRGIIIYACVETMVVLLKIARLISLSWLVVLIPVFVGMISLLVTAVIFVYGGTAERDDDEEAHYKEI